MSTRSLPARPNLEQYRKQAKELVKRYEAGDAEAVARVAACHRRRRKLSTRPRRAFGLSDAQAVLAREHGFASWLRFVRHLESVGRATPPPGDGSAAVRLQTPTRREVNLGIFVDDGSRIVTATEGEPVRLWDARSGTCLHEFGSYSIHAWALHVPPDGRSLVIGGRDGVVRVVDFQTGDVAKGLVGHRGMVRCLDVSPDMAKAVSGGMRDHELRVWDVASERCAQVLAGHRDGIYAVAFDERQRRALSGSRDTTVRLWDLERGECLRVLEGHTYHVHSVAWAADGHRALSCSRDIRLWDVDTGRCIRVFTGHEETIRSVAWSEDQRYALSAAHDRTVRVWDVERGVCAHVFTGHSDGAINAAWSADGRRIFSCDWTGQVRVWLLAA